MQYILRSLNFVENILQSRLNENVSRLVVTVYKLKGVLILGSSVNDGGSGLLDVVKFYDDPDYLIIGDGTNPVKMRDLNALQGIIDKNTRIDLNFHGDFIDGVYKLINGKNHIKVSYLFELLAKFSNNAPLQVHLWSCYGGAANSDVASLSKGSILFTYVPENATALSYMGQFSLAKSLAKVNEKASALDNYVNSLPSNLVQTASIATYINDQHHQLTFAPDMQEVIKSPKAIFKKIIDQIHNFSQKLIEQTKQEKIAFHFKFAKPSIMEFAPLEVKQFQSGYLSHFCDVTNLKQVDSLLSAENTNDLQKFINTDISGRNSFFDFVDKGNEKLVELFLASKFDVNKIDHIGFTALHIASLRNYPEIVKILINAKAKIDKVNKEGQTPLFIAVDLGHKEILKLLLANNADVNKTLQLNKKTCHVLHVAVAKSSLDIVKLLIKAKANINAADQEGHTSLYIAVDSGYKEKLELLLANGADVNKPNVNGITPLARAATKGNAKFVEVLIAHNADVDKANIKGNTALHAASALGFSKIVKLLVQAKANLSAKNKYGDTPLDYAKSEHHQEVTKILKNAIDVKHTLKGTVDVHQAELHDVYHHNSANYDDEL